MAVTSSNPTLSTFLSSHFLSNYLEMKATRAGEKVLKTNPNFPRPVLSTVWASSLVCWRPGGYSVGWSTHNPASCRHPFPPSFFPLNPNLLPSPPPTLLSDDAFNTKQKCLLWASVSISEQGRCVPSSAGSKFMHCLSSLLPLRGNRRWKWWGEMFAERLFVWRRLSALLS